MRIPTILKWSVFSICAIAFVISGIRIISILTERKEAETAYESFQSHVTIIASPHATTPTVKEESPSEGSTDEPVEPSPPSVVQDYAPISVDFSALTAECEDIVGWIYGPDTPIHYPVAQGEDNNEYLRHLPNGKYNIAGTIFIDFRNGSPGEDDNLIIYGHNMDDDSMFGSLEYYHKQSYYDDHPTLYFLTDGKNYRIDIYAGFVTPSTSDSYTIQFENPEIMEQYMLTARENSTFVSETTYQPGDQIVTLSTCSYEYDIARYVLIGILREL